MAGGRNDERQNERYDEQQWAEDGYELRPGHHYGDDYDRQRYGQQTAGPAEPDAEYDPRAYAPNPDEPYGYDDSGQPLYYQQEPRGLKSGGRGMLMVGAVLAVAIVGGAGAVGYKMLGHGGFSGEPPLIKADTEPVKTVPEKAADTTQNKAIYDRVDGGAPAKSKVVSREEEPVDLPRAPASEPRTDGSRIILPGGAASAEPTAPSTHGAEPRRVKTVAIRPDMPTAAPQPATPQIPAPQPNTQTAAADPIAEAARTGQAPRGSEFDNGIMADGDAPRLAATPTRPATPPAAARPATPQAQPQTQTPPQAARPAPTPAPAQPAPRATDPSQVAAVAPRAAAPAAAAAQPARPSTGGFVVQVTSQRSEADARTAYASLQKRFPQVLGPYQPSIQSANVGDRGVYYRVRVGPFGSSTDASTVCNNLRAAGGDCVVARN